MDSSECVKVAVNVRPLITPELLMGCTDCITIVPNEPQVQIGSHSFTYDYVYSCANSSKLYEECIAPIIEALYQGYNATVLAYGQTGSGKTYTMGTNYAGDSGNNAGIIPNVMETIFKKLDAHSADRESLIRVSFIEIFKEEVFDLLDPSLMIKPDGGGAKTAPLSRVPIQIRETTHGGITLAGVTEPEVRTKEEMASYLLRGSLTRATGSTNMNSQSSRSHAIFTISLEQKKLSRSGVGEGIDDLGDDILSSKLHLVDLAGSERAKRTGADGLRLKEGIHINKGLLALGNVISALGDEKKRKEGGHVPYRDSKLTRLLQDSLGGNSKTIMIACVSPAETNAEETLNTLKYANRARNIQNKAIVNRDPVAAQMQRMRGQIEQLQNELSFYRGDNNFSIDEFQTLKQKMYVLEIDNKELKRELECQRETCQDLTKRAIDAKTDRDKLAMQIELARNGKSWDEIEDSHENIDLLQNYASKIKELEETLLRLKTSSKKNHDGLDYSIYSDVERFFPQSELFPSLNEISCDSSSKDEMDDEEIEHSTRQEKLDKELMELDKKLEIKEAEMKRFPNVDNAVIKLHYEKKVQELEHQKRALQKEIDLLKNNLENISLASDESTQKLKQDYLQKLTLLESQVVELKKKQDAQAQLLRQKQKSEEAARRLNEEIQKIKTQKVQLQQKIKQESEQFRHWKASREKEVLQLKKEGRRNEYEMHKLLALNQRQKMALQRKTEEAAMASKRLREVLEGRRIHLTTGNAPQNQALLQAIEHELEIIVRVHEVRSAYERQLEERGKMASELARLKEESSAGKHLIGGESPSALSPGARTSRIIALENMLAASSDTLVSMASQLSEVEERERGFAGRVRWNHVRTIADAKNTMNHLFNLASTSRCLLREREMSVRDKDDEIKSLKDKIVKLSSILRYQQQQLKLQRLTKDVKNDFYNLRKSQGVRQSMMLMEDMDTSDTNQSDENSDNSSDEDYSISREKANDDEAVRPKQKKAANDSSESDKVERRSCCTCSKSSSCKTSKCQCRAGNGWCGSSCGCAVTKCSNRVKEESESESLVSQGATLLRNALDSEATRRPLSDIGNSQTKKVGGNPSRKKWKKAVIQLVPEENAVTENKEEKEEEEGEVPMSLPRAMQAPASTHIFRERNAEESQDRQPAKDAAAQAILPRRFPRPPKPSTDKENYGK